MSIIRKIIENIKTLINDMRLLNSITNELPFLQGIHKNTTQRQNKLCWRQRGYKGR